MIFDFLNSGLDWVWHYAIPFVVVLSLLVFVHEWGHYAVARYYKVKIDAFSIGFGPELFGWTDKSGCRWKFCAIPLGGFVKMFGDAGAASTPDAEKIDSLTEAEKKNTFYGQPVHARAAIVFAGPLINYLFAILVLGALFVTVGRPVTPPVVGSVLNMTPAAEAGLLPGDRLTSLNGEKIERFEDVARYVTIHLDQPMTITLERDGKPMTLENVHARKMELEDRFGFKQERALLGITSTGVALDIAKVTKVDGKPVATPDDVLPAIMAQRGKTLVVSLIPQAGKTEAESGFTVTVPREGAIELKDGVITLQKPAEEIVRYNPLTGIGMAFVETYNITVSTLKALWQMVTGVRSAEELGGLIRIGAVASDAAAGGFVAFIMFAALLSINLGLINMFPVPMLDGGHLAFYAYEAIFGKPIPEKVQEGLFRLGFFALLVLMVFANGNDILQLLL